MASRVSGWSSSDRRSRLPVNWSTPGGIRDQVFKAKGRRCKLNFVDICTKFATQVDHIVPGDDHRLDNLQPVCGPCHARKSAQEGAAAVRRRKPPKKIHPALR